MAKWRMAQVMGERCGLHKICHLALLVYNSLPTFITSKTGADGPTNVGTFKAMGESRTYKVQRVCSHDLRLALKPAKGMRMDNSVAVHLRTRPWIILLSLGLRSSLKDPGSCGHIYVTSSSLNPY
jgi:hypothetical protein